MTQLKLIHGDCLEELDWIPNNSIDSIVTDPPYGLTKNKKGGSGTASVALDSPYGRARIGTGVGSGGFMGLAWDSDVPSVDIWRECLRVLKPGGHVLSFAGTRTYHRMAVAIEDAGFEIRDQIGWVYGSGFPKSHNGEWGGTALKPAWEPIVLARKALIGTVEKNFEQHGTGGLNIDGCRVGDDVRPVMVRTGTTVAAKSMSGASTGATSSGEFTSLGRWPANLIHDGSDEVVSVFPSAQGQQGATGKRKQGAVYGTVDEGIAGIQPRGDSGSAARFFYCAKASKSDRGDVNTHPTVKPTDLMRYLCRLITPSGGIVFDPFMGSGSTGKAALAEGFRFIGIEREAAYMKIAQARLLGIRESVLIPESEDL